MAARYAEVTDAGRRWRERSAPPTTLVEVACAGGGPAIDAILLDVSTFGCRVRGERAEDVGDHVRLRLGDHPAISATVIWRGDGMIGCRFDKPIATTVMRALICGDA